MDNLPVNAFDIAVAVVLLSSAALAYARGFVHETLSILGWVGAILATIYGYSYALPYFQQLLGSDIKGDLATGITLFVVSLTILSLISRAISRQVQESALNAVDRSLGFLFGLARGGLILVVLYMAVDWLAPRFPALSAEQQAEAARDARAAESEGIAFDDPRYGWPSWVESAKTVRFVAAGADQLWAVIPDETFGEAKSEAEQARERAIQLMETEKTLRGLISPSPEPKQDLQKDGYGVKERQELERLLNQAIGDKPEAEQPGSRDLPVNPLEREH